MIIACQIKLANISLIQLAANIIDGQNINSFNLRANRRKAKDNLKDTDLLNMFTKVQQLDKGDLTAVKSLLKAYIFQKETQQRLA